MLAASPSAVPPAPDTGDSGADEYAMDVDYMGVKRTQEAESHPRMCLHCPGTGALVRLLAHTVSLAPVLRHARVLCRAWKVVLFIKALND